MDSQQIRAEQGSRLREERKRFGMSQKDFGAQAGVARLAQLQYENGSRTPSAVYLEALHKIQCDIYYIVTGVRALDAARTVETREIEQTAFAMVDDYVNALPGQSLGSRERYALFDAFRLQLMHCKAVKKDRAIVSS